MRSVYGAIAAVSVLLLAGSAASSPLDLQEELVGLVRSPESAGITFGIVFAPVDGGAATFENNADRPFPPASLTKLATTGFALETLGAAFTYRTSVYGRGSILDGVLHGDLVVQGGGDPFFVSERLWLFANLLASTGLRGVNGDLIIDDTLFAPQEDDPSFRAAGRGRTQRAYAAIPAALTVNFNAACFLVGPGSSPGEPGVIIVDPLPCDYLKVENTLRTVRGEGSWSLHLRPSASGISPLSPGFSETGVAAGTIPAGSPMRRVYRSVADPATFAGSMVRTFLEDAGISIHGSTGRGKIAAGDSLLMDFPSPPMANLLSSMNRFSNNLMADMIVMRCGAPHRGESAHEGAFNLTHSAESMSTWLRERFGAGVDEVMHDGSGLHPDNRISGRTILRLLTWAWNSLDIGPDFAASLPRPGEDGTLSERFGRGAPGILRAKTGTYNDLGVSALAGYAQDSSGRISAFVMILQSDGKSATWNIPRMQGLQERWLAAYLRRNSPESAR